MPITDVLTPEYIKKAVLPTVRFEDKTGKCVADDFFYAAIDSAIADVEAFVGISLRVDHRKQNIEFKDTLEWHDETFFLKKMLTRPLRSVEKLTIGIPTMPQGEVDIERVHLTSNRFGQIQILPGAVNYFTPYFTAAAAYFPTSHYVPAYLKVTFTAGFDVPLPGEHTTATGSTTVVITGDDTDSAYNLEPGSWVKVNGEVRRVKSVISGTSYTVSAPFTVTDSNQAIHLTYPASAYQAVSALAALPLLSLAGSLLYGAGVTGKVLGIDGMVQRKGIDPRGPYANWQGELQKKADEAKRALYSEYTPVRGASF